MANISIKNLSIEFIINKYGIMLAAKNVINRFRNKAHSELEAVKIKALQDINLDIPAGTKLGLIGHNGSGKTTLLRVLAGVYEPTEGTVEISGKVASLLDIGLGMEADSTGYENIAIRGFLLGLTPKEVDNKMDEIASVTGLGEYLNYPIRTYSSGMIMRLGFAVSTVIDADIVVMDEWLSVGDEKFQKKAEERLNFLMEKASVIAIASHNIQLIKNVCNKICIMENGKISNFLE